MSYLSGYRLYAGYSFVVLSLDKVFLISLVLRIWVAQTSCDIRNLLSSLLSSLNSTLLKVAEHSFGVCEYM